MPLNKRTPMPKEMTFTCAYCKQEFAGNRSQISRFHGALIRTFFCPAHNIAPIRNRWIAKYYGSGTYSLGPLKDFGGEE